MNATETELLLEAQERAIAVLTDARTRAESIREAAADNAVALLLQQQDAAAQLLAHPTEDPLKAITRAEELLQIQQVEAASLHEDVEREAVEILLAAQREAAAILLRARMAIEEARGSSS